MADWQSVDGTRSSVLAFNQLANILRMAAREHRPFPASMRELGLGGGRSVAALVLCSPLGTTAIQGGRRSAAGGVPLRTTGVARALSPRSLVGAGRLATSLRPADPTVGTGTAGETTDAHRDRSPCRGCGKRSSGTWAPNWKPGRCAGRPSARNGFQNACNASTTGSPVSFDDPAAVARGTPRQPPGRRPRSRRWTADPTNLDDPRRDDRRHLNQARPTPARSTTTSERWQSFSHSSPVNPGAAPRPICGSSDPGSGSPETHVAGWLRQVSRIPSHVGP